MRARIQFLNRWWAAGILLAAAGVGLTRLASPADPGGPAVALRRAGALVALGGLAVIAVGVSRRVHRGGSA